MKNTFEICRSTLKIELQNGKGSGFFITFERNKKEFYCIMTNEHVITPEMIKDKEEINIKYDNESKSFIIKLDSKERDIQCFKKILNIDLTIIEIIEKDNIKRKYFLESYFNDNEEYEQFLKKAIKISQFPKGKELSLSEGIISKINDNNKYEFFHNANTKGGSSGSPIFLEGEIRVLGIHRGGTKKKNLGCFIGPAINYMKNLKRESNFLDDNSINKEESKDKEVSDDENGNSNNNKEDSDKNGNSDDDDKDNKKDDSDKKGSSDDDKDNKKDIMNDNSDKNDDSDNNDDLDDNQKDNMKDNSDKKDDDYDNNNDSDDNKNDNSVENNGESEENNNSEKSDVSDENNKSDKNGDSDNNKSNDTYSKNDVHSNNNNNNNNNYNYNNNINTGLNLNNFFNIAKTESYHVLHGLGNLIGIKCIACGHHTKSHEAIGFGKWKCHECKYICSTLHQ